MVMRISVCPRCGKRVSYVKEKKVNGRVYLYAVHWECGRRRECYLGPKDRYEYVTRMHEKESLVFKGLTDRYRALEYLTSLTRYFLSVSDGEVLSEALAVLSRAVDELKRRAEGS